MIIAFGTFIENAYHYLMEVLESDSIARIKLKNGNVVIISEERFKCLLDLLAEK